MKDSAIFKSYTVFVDSFVDKDDSYYMHPYGVCIANAVISPCCYLINVLASKVSRQMHWR